MNRRLVTRWAYMLTAMLVLALGIAHRANAANLAAGKPCFATWNSPVIGNGGQDTTANATDNNYNSQWDNTAVNGGAASASAPMDKIGVDLGAIVNFRYLRVAWATDRASTFTVEVCDDVDMDPASFGYGESISGNWVTVFTRDPAATPAKNPEPANFDSNKDLIDLWADNGLSSLNHRYIRISGTASSNTNNLWGVKELQVFDIAPPTVTGKALFGASPVNNTIVELVGPQAVTNGPGASCVNLKTDATGTFTFSNLYDGTYFLFGIAPGQYAPVQTMVTVAGGSLTQDLTFTQAVQNTAANTAPLPAYSSDNITASGETNGANTTSGGYALPVDELPMQPGGDALWTTGDAAAFRAPTGTEVFGEGTKVPPGLHFWVPPYGSGKNNVIPGANTVLPVPSGKYSALYILQNAADGNFDVQATLNYADGTSQPVNTVWGSTNYRFTDGPNTQDQDEINAFVCDKRYTSGTGATVTEGNSYRVFLRFIVCDSTKVLKNVTFSGGLSSNGTTSKGLIYGYSGDTVGTPTAVGSISGTVLAPVALGGTPVKNAVVSLYSYRIVTDATGAYALRGLPADTYTVTANKPANYPNITVTVPVAAGAAVTKDIQFPYAIPVITDPLTNPNLDEASSDDPDHKTDTVNGGKYWDFAASAFGLGSEYMPKGRWNPTMGNPAYAPEHHNGYNSRDWEAASGAPEALTFDFGDPTIDSPVAPGVAGYPLGGVPNMICIHDMEILAPQTKVLNAYLAITGLDGAINISATLHYADGTSETKIVTVSDWYQGNSINELPFIVMHGRHTNNGRTPPWEDGEGMAKDYLGAGNPASDVSPASIFIKALVIPCDGNKILHDITFDHGDQSRRFPIVSAISWETATPTDPSSDIRITVTKSDSTPAAGAWVVMGPYSTKCDATGVAIFKGMPAHQVVSLGAFILGQTKQKTVADHVVPSGMKMPTPDDVAIQLSAEAPQFVYLPLNYDYDMISMSDMTGDYKGCANNDRGFNGDLMPASNTIVNDGRTNYVPFKMPIKETWYSNVQRMDGQTWTVTPGHYSNFSFLVTGQGVGDFPNARYNHVTLNYSDGSHDQVQVANHDWVGNYSAPGTTSVRGAYYRELPTTPAPNATDIGFNIRSRRNGDSDEFRNADSTAAFTQEFVPVDATRTLVSISWPKLHMALNGSSLQSFTDNDFSILAVTLEANDTAADATITGRVVGQPMGSTAAGPIGLAKVIADDAHMAYTAADGTFTLGNVPTTTQQLTVVPLGQGILTKTFPVTIAAGANGVGDLNVGAAQRYIYAVLGPTNNENGLHLLSGSPVPYAYDTSRPNNKINYPLAGTSPIIIGGKAARQNRVDNTSQASDHYYFRVDPGWLWHGRMGDPGTLPVLSADGNTVITPGTPATGAGLDLSTFVAVASAPRMGAWKPAPKVYMFIEYYDNAKPGQTDDVFYLAYNKLEGWIHNSASTSWNTPGGFTGSAVSTRFTNVEQTVRIKNSAGTGTDQWNVVKGSTNTWKTFTYELNPIQNQNPVANNLAYDAFGCYAGGPLGADFKLDCWYKSANGGDNPDIIRSVIISLDPTLPVLPATPSASDALRISAGLQAADSTTMAVDDVVSPKPLITIQDSIGLAKAGLK